MFFADGRIIGTMGGGCLEAEIQERARRALLNGRAETFDLVLDHDFGWDDGLICGGRVSGVILPDIRAGESLWRELARRDVKRTWAVTSDFRICGLDGTRHVPGTQNVPGSDSACLYTETVTPPFALWIAGAGHIAQAVAPMALAVDFEVTVFDDRAALASRSCFASPVHLRSGGWDELLAQPLPEERPAFGLIVTRGHRHDALVLRQWIGKPFAFLGMIGSRRKARTILDHFLAEGIAGEEALKSVSSPVGLDIGAISVPEIAVSIVAQLIEKRAAYVAESQSDSAGRGAAACSRRGSLSSSPASRADAIGASG